MENQNKELQKAANEINEYTANLMVNQKKSATYTKNALIEKGLEEEVASEVVENFENEIRLAKKENASKDIIYGSLWCFGGIVATLSELGYIFWGAILFGGIQLIKGIVNSSK